MQKIPDTDEDGIAFFERYWTQLCGARPLPAPGEIDPLDFPRFLPCIFLLDGATLETLTLRLAGTFYRELYGFEITGKGVTELIPFDRTPDILEEYRACLYEARLAFHTGEVTWRDRGAELRYRRILMPFGSNNQVTRIMGFAEFHFLS